MKDVRRDLHAQPELGNQEHRTTGVLFDRLSAAGLTPKVLSRGTGLVCDVGSGDAPSSCSAPTSTRCRCRTRISCRTARRSPGLCHACGHDVHTTAVLGAGLALADELAGGVRLVFQPAEEQMPGGALDVIADGWMNGVESAFGLHCDLALEVGRVGLKSEGPCSGQTART